MEHLVLVVVIIGVLGVGAQWLAWRLNLPAIVLMSIAGLLAGPVFGILRPMHEIAGLSPMDALFGDLYQPMIAIAVAVILFEGGLSLNFSEIRGLSKGVLRLIFPGVPLAWAFGAVAAYYVGELSWPTALLFAGVMVVTGPTVIIPLLRQSKLNVRPAALLKWEGIVNDPIGALLAVLVFKVITLDYGEYSTGEVLGGLAIAAALTTALGFSLGKAAATVFRRGWAPEYLKPPILLTLVLVCFQIANLLQDEAGLLAVTVMGVTIANSRISSINELRLFKENIAVLLVSGVFVMLTANLTPEILSVIDLPMIALIAVLLFIVRPMTVMVATIGAGLPWQERVLAGWIAPRGIVAVAVLSLFGTGLVEAGYADGERLVALAFGMVFATVILHGFTIAPLAKALNLASRDRPGVLIVGGSPWSASLGAMLVEMQIPVKIADASWRRLRPARLADVPTYYGEILSEVTEHHLDLNRFGYLLAVGGNEAHNALVCTDLAPELGRASIFQVNARGKDDEDRRALSFTLQGRTFLHSAVGLDELISRYHRGWVFQQKQVSEDYLPEAYLKDLGAEGEIIFFIRKSVLLFASREAPIKPEIGDIALSYVPKAVEPIPAPPNGDKPAVADGPSEN